VVIKRGSIYWADLGPKAGSRPAKRRPVLVVSADAFNRSHLATVLAAALTSNTALAAMPGNVFLPAAATGLPRDSVVDVTGVVILNKTDLTEHVGSAPVALLDDVNRGLRRVLDL
jgi:mRNA interferase MazF